MIMSRTTFSIQTTSMDPDQTAPSGAVWSVSTLVCYTDVLNGLVDDIADDIEPQQELKSLKVHFLHT